MRLKWEKSYRREKGKEKQFLTIGKVKTFLEKGLFTCDVAFNLQSFRGKFPSSPLVID